MTFRGKSKVAENQLMKEMYSQHETSVLWAGAVTCRGAASSRLRRPCGGHGPVSSSEGTEVKRPPALR